MSRFLVDPSVSYPFENMPEMTSLIWTSDGTLSFHYSGLAKSQRLIHAVFTRHGGLSDAPYRSLNMSYAVGDRFERVKRNLGIVRESVKARHLIFMNQVHGDRVVVLRYGYSRIPDEAPAADAIITDMPLVALMVKQADCQGVIIWDCKRNVVANVHCGWRGHVRGILGRVVSRIKAEFGSRESDLAAAIGPSLGPCCAEFVSYKDIFPESFRAFMAGENHFDLWALSRWQLTEAGLRKENIETAGICTRCRTDLFYSYRGEGVTGRFGTVAMIV